MTESLFSEINFLYHFQL